MVCGRVGDERRLCAEVGGTVDGVLGVVGRYESVEGEEG